MIVTSRNYEVQHELSVYNAMDCCITREVFDVLKPQLDETSRKVYDFERALQRVALFIMLRGVKVDPFLKMQISIDYEKSLKPLREQFDAVCRAAFGATYNENSSPQMQELFYKKFKHNPFINRETGKPTVDDKALERLAKKGGLMSLAARYVLELRKTKKIISTLKAQADPDGRIRESINVAGTETGRWSSCKPVYGNEGMSGQNITEKLRKMFIADDACRFIYVDLDQAESRVVGLISWRDSGQDHYLQACESGDIHTAVCLMTWPERDWPKDLAEAREVAEKTMLNSKFSYRDIAKRLGHGTNYLGSASGMAYEIKVPEHVVADFQARYFRAFPDIKKWHEVIVRRLQLDKCITTLLERRRYFFGRLFEASTIREAIAYEPQSVIGDTTNIALSRAIKSVEVLKNLHDGALFQAPEDGLLKAIEKVKKAFEITLAVERGNEKKQLIIPCEVRTGWNWGKHSPMNENGLKLWKNHDTRTRKKSVSMLDLRI